MSGESKPAGKRERESGSGKAGKRESGKTGLWPLERRVWPFKILNSKSLIPCWLSRFPVFSLSRFPAFPLACWLWLAAAWASAQTMEFFPAAPTVYENGTNINVVVTRTPPTGSGSVDFMTQDGTAVAGADYAPTNGTLAFVDGESFKLITVLILDDAVPEPTKTFNLLLSNPVGGALGLSGVTVSIFDDDAIFRLLAPTNSVREDGTNVVIDVVRVGGLEISSSVDFFTVNGGPTVPAPAIAPGDFTSTAGTLTFNPGQGTNTIRVPIVDDCDVESNEVFSVILTNAIAGMIGTPSITDVTILDNDTGAGTLAISLVTPDFPPFPSTNVLESATNLTVRVSRLCGTNAAVSVNYRIFDRMTFDLLAQCPGREVALSGAGNDYALTAGTLMWAQGDNLDKTFTISITDDLLVELDETFIIELFNPTGGANLDLTRARQPIRILFDDQPPGAGDRTFNALTPLNPTPGANNTVYAVAAYNDPLDPNFGKCLVAGDFTGVNAIERNGIARLHTNGLVDLSFDPGSGADGFVSSVAIQPDGRVLLGGGFSSIDNRSRNGVARLNSNGALDNSFNPGAGTDGPVLALALQGDGKVVIVGEFSSVNNVPRRRIARLNADGSVDSSYDPGAGADNTVYAVALQPDGKAVLGGVFQSVQGVPLLSVARLNFDGSLDLSFAPLVGADNAVYAVAVQPFAILIGGSFTSYDSVSRASIARLNLDGSLDTTFNPCAGADGPVRSIKLQSDGWIVVGGEFTSYNGTPRFNAVRLYPDGTIETSFLDSHYNQSLPGLDGSVNAVDLYADGRVLVGGAFSVVGGGFAANEVLPRFNFARLIGGTNPPALNLPGNVEFVSAQYSVDENVLGGAITITVERLNGEMGPLAVDYATSDGTALSGVNYVGGNGTLTWFDCELGVRTFVIPILDNTLVEGNRTFHLTLSNPRNPMATNTATTLPALGLRCQSVVTIVDNDFNRGVLGFRDAVYTVSEAGVNATITVTRTNGTTGSVSVQYATANGSALAPGDYTATNGTLTFGPTESNKTFQVRIINDTAVEFEESLNVRLFNVSGGASLGRSNATLLIFDNENGAGSISFTNSDFRVEESSGLAVVTLRRTSGASGTVGVTAFTSDLPPTTGAARSGVDYTGVTNTLFFSNGVTSQTFLVPINPDALVEGDEVLSLTLSDVTGGARLGFFTNASLRIVDDDFYGSLSLASGQFFVNEEAGTATITVARTGGSAEEVSVDYATAPGLFMSATESDDYAAQLGTLVFGDGVLSRSFTVPIVNDDLLEGNETLSLVLSNFAKAAPGAFTSATLTIVDDEALHVPAGSVDTFFDPIPGPNDFVNAVAVQGDGQLVVGGQFTAVNNIARSRLARLNVDGSVDSTFDPGAGADDIVRAVAVQSDGKIVVGGNFTRLGNRNRNGIARLTQTGQIDSSFNPGAGADNLVLTLALQDDGAQQKILIGGEFSTFNSVSRNRVARLNANGSLDSTFTVGSGANGAVYAIAVQSDGPEQKVLIGGAFTSVNNVQRRYLARLNADGSVDTSFNAANGLDAPVRSVALLPGGRVLIGGDFTRVGVVARNRVAQLNPDGTLDPSFDPGTGANDIVNSVAVQDDGKVLLGGEFTEVNGLGRNRIARLTASGALDTTINFGPGANGFIATVVLQPDQQIVIGGGFTEVNGYTRRYLARLVGGSDEGPGSLEFAAPGYRVNENGTNVTVTVLRNSGATGTVGADLVIQNCASNVLNCATAGADFVAPVSQTILFNDGEVAKSVTLGLVNDGSVEGDEVFTLGLTNASGGAVIGALAATMVTILEDDSDVSFSLPSYTVNENVVGGQAAITLRRSGSTNTVVEVDYATGLGTAQPGADYTPTSGTVTFQAGETSKVFTVQIVNDTLAEFPETIGLALFNARVSSSSNSTATIARSVASLTIADNDLSPGNLTFSAPAYSAGEQAGSVTITVLRTNGFTGVVTADYLSRDGTATSGLDYTNVAGRLVFGDGVTVQSVSISIRDDTAVEGNETLTFMLTNLTGGAALVGPDTVTVTIEDNDFGPGSPDTGFDPGTGANGFVRSVSVHPDGKLVLGGAFTTFDGRPRNHIARLLPDGALDLGFNPGQGPNGLVSAVAALADGKVMLGGGFTSVSGLPFNRVARLNANGSPDGGFNQVPSFNAAVYALGLQTNGEFMVGGGFSQPIQRVAQLRLDGSLNTGFSPGSGADGTVLTTLVQPDGRILIGGGFSTVSGLPRTRVARFNPNGLVDLGFTPPRIDNGVVLALAVQADGKVLLGGDFSIQNSEFRIFNSVARLNSDGSLDNTFDPGSGANGSVYALGVQSSGRILLGGDFTTVNNTNRGRFARLNADGSLDLTFDPGTGANGTVYSLAVLPDGNLIIAGDFTVVNGFLRNGVARIRAAEPGARFTGLSFVGGKVLLLLSSQPGVSYALDASPDLANWTAVSTNTATGSTVLLSDPAGAGFDQRFYRARQLGP